MQPRHVKRINKVGEKLFQWGMVAVLAMLALLELSQYGYFPYSLAILAPQIVAAWMFLEYRSDRYRLLQVPAWLSLVTTLALTQVMLGQYQNYFGASELVFLGLMVIYAVRGWKDPGDYLTVGVLVLAILATPLRSEATGLGLVAADVMLAFPTTVAVAIGLYLRGLDNTRKQSVDQVRQEERTEMAREIHDFVAHHVTGMVVRAQAARFAAVDRPEEAARAFEEIEQAGTEALKSMRRMVAMLRRQEDGAEYTPLGDIAQIKPMVESWARNDVDATVFLSPQLTAVPPDVEATAFRVVREALTNIRKHAPDAATVRVTVSRAEEGIEVTVRDNGSGKNAKKFAASGFGLVGLSERVRAVGGLLRWGPREDGLGWEVSAFLPDEIAGEE
ncbi:sensor histidine kinase [Salininema proteolyticum]|uniref:histidine kinase n=1 Tax=Salininema proteolyticum TaxID=1607685 RepID=A0ABV8U0Q3_9ACTN